MTTRVFIFEWSTNTGPTSVICEQGMVHPGFIRASLTPSVKDNATGLHKHSIITQTE